MDLKKWILKLAIILFILFIPFAVFAEEVEVTKEDLFLQLVEMNERLERAEEYILLLFEDKDINDMKDILDNFSCDGYMNFDVMDDEGEGVDVGQLVVKLDKVLGWLEKIGAVLYFFTIIVLPLVVFVGLGWVILKQFF